MVNVVGLRTIEIPVDTFWTLTKHSRAWLELNRYETPMMSLLWLGIVCIAAIAVINGLWYVEEKKDNKGNKTTIAELINKIDELTGGREMHFTGPHIPFGPETLSTIRKILRLAVDNSYRNDNPDMVTEYSLIVSDDGESFSAIMPINLNRSVKIEYIVSYCRYLIEYLMSRISFYPKSQPEWYELNTIMDWEKRQWPTGKKS